MYVPVISIDREDIEELDKKYGPPSDRVKIEGDDGNTYVGKLISWTKRPCTLR